MVLHSLCVLFTVVWFDFDDTGGLGLVGVIWLDDFGWWFDSCASAYWVFLVICILVCFLVVGFV